MLVQRLRAGSGKVIEAARAVAAAGFTEKVDFCWTLHAVFVSRPDDAGDKARLMALL
jgi:uncharacterized protein